MATFAEIDQHIAARLPQVRSFLVLQDGELIHERYFRGAGPQDPRNILSVNKSLISALAGILLEQKLLTGLDQTVTSLLGEYCPPKPDPQLNRLTLRHLLTMTSGLYYPRLAADSQPVWERTLRSDHWVRFSLELPIRDAMGERFTYKNTDALLAAAMLVRATGRSIGELAEQYLFGPLGLPLATWQPDDPQGLGTGIFHMGAREMARFGQLYLDGGALNGRQLVPPAWVQASTARQSGPYGYFWWVHPNGFSASGAGGQVIRVVPDKRLVVVFQSEVLKRFTDPSYIVDQFLAPAQA